MSITLGPAPIIAILLGLFATGAVDFVNDDGNTKALGWVPFALTLVLVARDTLFRGRFRDGLSDRVPGLDLNEGQLRLRAFDFEPVATTLAIITGLLASGAVDFYDGNGGGSAWAWTAFALSLFLSIGGRLNKRPRPPKEHEADVRNAEFWENLMRNVFERRRRH